MQAPTPASSTHFPVRAIEGAGSRSRADVESSATQVATFAIARGTLTMGLVLPVRHQNGPTWVICKKKPPVNSYYSNFWKALVSYLILDPSCEVPAFRGGYHLIRIKTRIPRRAVLLGRCCDPGYQLLSKPTVRKNMIEKEHDF